MSESAIGFNGLNNGLEEFFDYKNQLMKDFLTNETILRLLDDDYSTVADIDGLLYEQVFPYEYLPDTVEHGQTFICCEVDIVDVQNKTFLIPEIIVWAFTHRSKIRLPNGEGIRTDKLTSEIVKILNGSRFYGLGELDFKRARRFSPNPGYQGREIRFLTKDFNRKSPTGKPVPSNRKER